MANQIDGGGLTDSTAALPSPSLKSVVSAVKIATPDLIIRDSETMSIEIMTDLIFEDIGGQELATISRHDLVTVSYTHLTLPTKRIV